MSTTGFATFDHTVQQTNQLLGKIEQELNWDERREQSYKALRLVLQHLRDRLPVNEAVQFGSQLTMLVKGIYYEGWNPSIVPIKMDQTQFLNNIRQDFPYSMDMEIEQMVTKVLNLIMDEIASGEKEEVKNTLPEDIADMIS